MNSARMHCSQLTKSTIAGWKKKKKKEENVEKKCRRRFHCNPNGHLVTMYISKTKALNIEVHYFSHLHHYNTNKLQF